jgi:hypothetical protein
MYTRAFRGSEYAKDESVEITISELVQEYARNWNDERGRPIKTLRWGSGDAVQPPVASWTKYKVWGRISRRKKILHFLNYYK